MTSFGTPSVIAEECGDDARRKSPWTNPRRLRDAAFCLLFTLLMVAMQYRSGAFSADLAFDPDEPAHAVSSLMVRDYLVQAFPHNPLTFANAFYAHYPKIAIGHWPPLFYIGEALWMLVAGRSRVALLLFVALCGAALMGSMYVEVRRRSSTVAALVSVAVFISSSIFQQMLCAVRPDLLLALMVFWATVYCGEWMRFESRRSRNLFIVLAVIAGQVHPRGAVLLLLPFVLLPLRRGAVKWKWAVAAAVLLLSLMAAQFIGASDAFSVSAVMEHAREYVVGAVFLTGWAGMILALAGLPLVFRESGQRQFWAAVAALAAAGVAFYVLVPVHWDYRFLISTLQAIAVLAGGGVQFAIGRISAARAPLRRMAKTGAIVVALVWMVAGTVRVEKKQDPGYRQLVAECVLCGHSTTLIAADPINEGGLIVEASLADRERMYTVLRGSKSLASSSWVGKNHRLLYASTAEVLRFLDEAHVSQVVVQDAYSREEVVQLRTAVTEAGSGWERLTETLPVKGISIYRRMSGVSR